MQQHSPEVNTLQVVHQLLQLRRRVESFQAVGCNNLLQLAHQALLCSRIEATCENAFWLLVGVLTPFR